MTAPAQHQAPQEPAQTPPSGTACSDSIAQPQIQPRQKTESTVDVGEDPCYFSSDAALAQGRGAVRALGGVA